jgi:hypothetical protein
VHGSRPSHFNDNSRPNDREQAGGLPFSIGERTGEDIKILLETRLAVFEFD